MATTWDMHDVYTEQNNVATGTLNIIILLNIIRLEIRA